MLFDTRRDLQTRDKSDFGVESYGKGPARSPEKHPEVCPERHPEVCPEKHPEVHPELKSNCNIPNNFLLKIHQKWIFVNSGFQLLFAGINERIYLLLRIGFLDDDSSCNGSRKCNAIDKAQLFETTMRQEPTQISAIVLRQPVANRSRAAAVAARGRGDNVVDGGVEKEKERERSVGWQRCRVAGWLEYPVVCTTEQSVEACPGREKSEWRACESLRLPGRKMNERHSYKSSSNDCLRARLKMQLAIMGAIYSEGTNHNRHKCPSDSPATRDERQDVCVSLIQFPIDRIGRQSATITGSVKELNPGVAHSSGNSYKNSGSSIFQQTYWLNLPKF
ncbi:hypothetical protein EAG_02899 [Camponotus floridanus]|uniref:Uncharacterized protein n=1 Tax=Camponotus floridanus TaxID=104421 RepID=E1ZVS2_CAMFO|nr:hypothetical protein EAG_02899 [Camponotus floridanus]